jgi:NAD(P)-dependent dehydrogenase (short-subunit alcohol dehydrogenase family)
MKTVVVTGSTRGIGRGLAENFLKRGCKVCITGRSQDAVDKVVAELAAQFGADNITGKACEVSKGDDLQALWDHAKAAFGKVDVWINNAGMSPPHAKLWEYSDATLEHVIQTNLTSVMLSNRIVIGEMQKQGGGQVWNMEGFGSNGSTRPGMTAYGATKRAVHYINRSMAKEVEGTPVQVCVLSPGMVVTDLLVGDYDTNSEEWKRVRKIFNILADKVETVTPWLVDGILAADKNGSRVEWLTTGKVFKRFIGALFKKRDLFADMGV